MAKIAEKKNGKPPLERSSYEFMVALLVATFTQLIPNWIAYASCWVVLAAVAIYFCCYSRGTVEYGGWRKFFLSICCIAFVVSISFTQVESRYQEENSIPPPIQYMTSYGGLQGAPDLTVAGNPPRVVSGIGSGVEIVDGRLLDKYKKKFDLMAVAFHTINGESFMDKAGLSKSKLVKIRPEDLDIKVEFNTQFLGEIEMGAYAPTYVLLAMPIGMSPEDFDTLNDAEDKGAQIIGIGTAIGEGIKSTPLQK